MCWWQLGIISKISFLLLFSTLFVYILCEAPGSKPLVFSKWPPKSHKGHSSAKSGRRTLVLQIRSNADTPQIVLKRLPQAHLLRSRPARPLKLNVSPHFLLKQHLSTKRPFKPAKFKFTGPSPPAEYIYEKPFSPAPQLYKEPIENIIHLTNDQFGPIHTVPAPNLGTKPSFDFETNHIQFEEHKFTPRPNTFQGHQYQVTEEPTNDLTLVDPLSGRHKYYAPDPDPSLPAPKIRPAIDPLSMPSNGKSLPLDVQSNYLQSEPANQALIQNLQPISQPQLQQAYALQVTNQPQLQQFLLQQGSSVPALSVYNPTYLVTQSNNLYNQHQQQQQQQLFKPNANFVNSINSQQQIATSDLSQEVASNGQILQAARDPANQIHPEFVQSQDKPQFAALVGLQHNGQFLDDISSRQHVQPQLANFYDQIANPQELAATNYIVQTPFAESYQNHLDLTHRQIENEQKLQQANLKLQQHLFQQGQQQLYEQGQLSAYEEHQRQLQQTLAGSPLRIFVPDDEYQSHEGFLQKRSDNFSSESEEDKESESLGVATSMEVSGDYSSNASKN